MGNAGNDNMNGGGAEENCTQFLDGALMVGKDLIYQADGPHLTLKTFKLDMIGSDGLADANVMKSLGFCCERLGAAGIRLSVKFQSRRPFQWNRRFCILKPCLAERVHHAWDLRRYDCSATKSERCTKKNAGAKPALSH
jgi:hypothetical protein